MHCNLNIFVPTRNYSSWFYFPFNL